MARGVECRMYEDEFPKVNDLVMVKIVSIDIKTGVYVKLLEYGNREGMILINELSKRRFRSVNRLVKVGRMEPVIVLRVDKEKGYLDLSKRKVTPEDIVFCEERFMKSKKVHHTVHQVAKDVGMEPEDVYRVAVWPLYRKHDHALDALKEALTVPQNFLAKEQKELELQIHNGISSKGDLDVFTRTREALIKHIKLRLSPTALRCSIRLDVMCLGYDGVVAVRESLRAGKQAAIAKFEELLVNPGDEKAKLADKVEVRLVAPPQYAVVTTAYEKDHGTQVLHAARDAINEEISKYKGGFSRAVSPVMFIGGDDDKLMDEGEGEGKEERKSESEESEGESEEEDEGMGKVEDIEGFEEELAPEARGAA